MASTFNFLLENKRSEGGARLRGEGGVWEGAREDGDGGLTSGGGGGTAEICTETLLTNAEFMHQISDCSREDFDKKEATFQGWRGGGRMEGGGVVEGR